MATDKSLRQHYDKGKKVDSFKEGFETVAGKAIETAKKAKEAVTSTAKKSAFTSNVDLGAIVSKQAKSAIETKVQNAILSKLGLSFLNPFIGLASLFGYTPFGLAPGLKPGQTQAQYEAAREISSLENRRNNLLDRRAAGKNYSATNLGKVTAELAKKKGLDIDSPNDMKNIDKSIEQLNIEKSFIPETPEVKSPFAKVVPETPTTIIPHLEGDKTISTPLDLDYENLKTAAQRELSKGPVTTAPASPGQMAKEAAKSRQAALEATRGGVGRNGGPGPGSGGAPGTGMHRAYGGLIGKPLPGRNRYL